MASISSDAYLDTATGTRTAGEAWTMTTCNLTIRTDTRWYSGAPASMTGTLGAVNLTTYGGFIIDGTQVRWMAYTSGTGNVPAINTSITGGGPTGILLGVYASLTSAPTAVGSAMPTTGYLKFMSISGGQFATGVSLTGIGATTAATPGSGTGADAPGWIEVVFDSSDNISNNQQIGNGVVANGGWFYLGTTTGTNTTIYQGPTNGAGTGTTFPALQVETSPGSGVYQWWNGVYGATWTTTTYDRPATDGRVRMYQVMDGGQFRFGYDGTGAVGPTPVSGCNIRVPNIFLRVALTASRASNTTTFTSSNSLSHFQGTNGKFSLNNCILDVGTYAYGCYSLTVTNCAIACPINAQYSVNSVTLSNCANGDAHAFYGGAPYLDVSYNLGTVSISNFQSYGYSAGSPFIGLTTCNNVSISNSSYSEIQSSSTGSLSSVTLGPMTNSTITNLSLVERYLFINGNYNTVTNFDYIERMSGATGTTGSNYLIQISGNYNKVDTITFGQNGTYANCHPRASTGVISLGTGYGNIVRNMGTYSAPLSTGATSTTRPTNLIYVTSSAGSMVAQNKIQRIFLTAIQGSVISISDNTATNLLLEQIYAGTYVAQSYWPIGQNTIARGISYTSSTPSSTPTSPAGENFCDFFNSTTTGRLGIVFSPPTSYNTSYVTTNFISSASGFAGSSCHLTSVGEYVILECPYFIKGYTGFANTAISSSGSGQTTNMSWQYQIDTGSGYGGTWKTLNLTNLMAETVTSTTGFKIKILITCTVASVSNSIFNIFLSLTTTSTDQFQNLYPLDTATLSLSGLISGSEVYVYQGSISSPSSATLLGSTTSSGTTYSLTHTAAGQLGYIVVFALGYEPIYLPYTFSTADSIPIQQTIDRDYAT